MDYKKKRAKNIAALLLFVALMLPSAIQFSHLFEGHEHVTCTEQTTHFHESNVECEVCSFQIASVNYEIVKYPNLVALKIYVKFERSLVSLKLHSFKITNTQLRAPPIFS
jgi:hypothetical protein